MYDILFGVVRDDGIEDMIVIGGKNIIGELRLGIIWGK